MSALQVTVLGLMRRMKTMCQLESIDHIQVPQQHLDYPSLQPQVPQQHLDYPALQPQVPQQHLDYPAQWTPRQQLPQPPSYSSQRQHKVPLRRSQHLPQQELSNWIWS
ncbi:hypothetical protein EYF80_059331 [Liparis tanakae]|uniref:Uncharacterized protein n=1 Tax=Liparis tanakae TaxID=230148 RepID=A0A4Z2ENY8_9TELE|nr:hypothetical protein EYF80_059331 [Liparis tanakae]